GVVRAGFGRGRALVRGAQDDVQVLLDDLEVGLARGADRGVVQLRQGERDAGEAVALLDVRQERDHPAAAQAVGLIPVARGELLVRVVVAVHGDAELVQVVLAGGAVGRVAYLLYGGEEQADQNRDDRDHHQQLDQREAVALPARRFRNGEHSRTPKRRKEG